MKFSKQGSTKCYKFADYSIKQNFETVEMPIILKMSGQTT